MIRASSSSKPRRPFHPASSAPQPSTRIMSLADRPPYLQPRIRHITSLRVHRLTVALAEVQAAARHSDKQRSSKDAIRGDSGFPTAVDGRDPAQLAIEGYDLAVPLKPPRVRYAATASAAAPTPTANGSAEDQAEGLPVRRPRVDSNTVEEASKGPVEQVVLDLVEDERAAAESLEQTGTGSSTGTNRRDLPDLPFRRNRRRTSQNGTSLTLHTLQESTDHSAATTARSSPPPPSPRTNSFNLISPSSPNGHNGTSTSTGAIPRRPSISLHRSRSRLTIPRHVDREKDPSTTMVGNARNPSGNWGSPSSRNASPLVSPVSPFFPSLGSPYHPSHSDLPARSSAAAPRRMSSSSATLVVRARSPDVLPEEMRNENHTSAKYDPSSVPGEPRIQTQDAQDTPRTSVAGGVAGTANENSTHTEQESLLSSMPASAPSAGMDNIFPRRARSTSISSVRTTLMAYVHQHQPGPRTGHRRDRSATVTSAHHQKVETGGSSLVNGGMGSLALPPASEENYAAIQMAQQQHQQLDDVPYVDQHILRNRLVRCFVTFATVETEPDVWQPPQTPTAKQNSACNQILRKSSQITTSPATTSVPPTTDEMHDIANALMPFYVSPIHIRSTHPTFSGLSPRSDYANWLSVRKAASHTVVVDVWVEFEMPAAMTTMTSANGSAMGDTVPAHSQKLHDSDFWQPSGSGSTMSWHKLKGVGGIVDLRRLHEVDETHTTTLPENTLIFTFAGFGDRLFYFELPTHVDSRVVGTSETHSSIGGGAGQAAHPTVDTIMERSLRETKMRKSVGLGELHHMMNLYSVIRDTERDVTRMEKDLNAKVHASAQAIIEARACSEQTNKVSQIQQSLAKIRTGNKEHAGRITSRRRVLQARRAAVGKAKEEYQGLESQRRDLSGNLDQLVSGINCIQLPIYRRRARLITQVNDVFEITPVDAPTLLYSILQVPLPIPQHASETAPPLSLPSSALPRGIKVDEDTISTALGFVALAVNQISHILERPLTYPLTCAGSKSLVKDNISIIQGPRR
ncbi:hypothetical protein QFC19_001320 [Naganishia cerealis]|uniref:Uncharacterized protein n=1 Tax=Naganishia cerealis TaxID=610337 RepID=A0ACC2WJ54_9TREE|nr:hypothetical protein QFC19_001320 [Naganishia cerealis]